MGRSFCRCWFCSGSAERLFLVNVIVDESVRLVVTRTSNLYNVISSFIHRPHTCHVRHYNTDSDRQRPVQLFFTSSSTSTDKHLLLVRPFRSDCWPVLQHVVLVVRPILHMATVAFFLQLWIASRSMARIRVAVTTTATRPLYKEISCLLYLFVLSFYWHSNGTRTPMRVVVRKVNCAWNSYGLCAKLY